jgi:hypothetical protein
MTNFMTQHHKKLHIELLEQTPYSVCGEVHELHDTASHKCAHETFRIHAILDVWRCTTTYQECVLQLSLKLCIEVSNTNFTT